MALQPSESESENSLVGEYSETELDDALPGTELDEPSAGPDGGSDAEQAFAGTELDDDLSGAELEDDFSGAELNEDFSGVELNEQDSAAEEGPDQKAAAPKRPLKRFLWLFLALGLLLLLLAGWFFFQTQQRAAARASRVAWFKINPVPGPEAMEKPFPAVSSSLTQVKPTILKLDAFLVPVKPGGKVTYISMQVSLSLSDEAFKEELESKMVLLRGVIYEVLQDQVERDPRQSASGEMEDGIAKTVNRLFTQGNVKAVSVDNWCPT